MTMRLVSRATYYCTHRSNVIHHLQISQCESLPFYYLMAGYQFKELSISNDAYKICTKMNRCILHLDNIEKINIKFTNYLKTLKNIIYHQI